MLIRVINEFDDMEHKNKRRDVGQVLNVTEKRANHIVKSGYAEKINVIELIPDDVDEPAAVESEEIAEIEKPIKKGRKKAE